jgi:hypothetical protein
MIFLYARSLIDHSIVTVSLPLLRQPLITNVDCISLLLLAFMLIPHPAIKLNDDHRHADS